MRMILALSLATAGLLSACSNEPEVAETEAPAAVEPTETVDGAATAPLAANAGWDSNSDRNFDRNEFSGYGDRGFLAWDKDKDQRLSTSEFESGWSEAGWRDSQTALTAFDDNGDTFLSNEEFFGEDEFGEWDANANGVLESNEWVFGEQTTAG